MDVTCKMHHWEKFYVYWCRLLLLGISVLAVKVRTSCSANYSGCINMTNERTGTLEGLDCNCNSQMLLLSDQLPQISSLILDGGDCPASWDAVRWLTTQLQSPELLEFLSVSNSRMDIREHDMNLLQNLKEFSVSRGSARFLHPRSFSQLRHLESLTLKGLRLEHFPDAVTGNFQTSINQTDITDMPLPSLQHLDLSGNAISDIPDRAFLHLFNLTYLDLAKNRLQRLDAEPLRYLRKLRTLNVSLNRIFALPHQGFSGILPHLQTLVMKNAGIFTLSMGTFEGLAHLQSLDLSFGVMATVHPLSLQGLDSLEEINMFFNPMLQSLPEQLLRPVNKTLRKINLSECKLSSIPKQFLEELPWLEEVNLSTNKISSMVNISFKGSTRLKRLNIACNSVTDIPLNFFEQTPSLEAVHLEGNSIASVRGFTFWNLDNLQSIDLSQNNLTFVEKQAFYNLQSLETLNLNNNFLARVPNNALYNIPALQELNLADNHLTNFPELPFVNRDALNARMYPKKAVIVDMRRNWLTCDCHTYRLIGDHEYIDMFWPGGNLLANLRFKKYEELLCVWPPRLRGQALYAPQQEDKLNPHFANLKSHCTDQCECYTRCSDSLNITLCYGNLKSVPQNLSKDTNVLDLSGNHLVKIGGTFQGLASLTALYLEYNQIRAVTQEDFQSLPNLTLLNLQHNAISTIEPESFANLQKLQFLYLDHNLLTGMQKEVLNSIPPLKEITLNSNPLICDCDLMWLKDWLQVQAISMDDVDSINCTTQSNETGAVVYFDDHKFMCNSTDVDVIIHDQNAETVTVCFGVLVFLMSISAIAYRFRRVIQVIVYNRTGWRFSNKLDKDMTRAYLYDAFISFSTDDLDFVTQELVPKLEGHRPPFRLCIHQRDFVVGECISTNIINAVETSRRTLIVLSNNFLASEWCSFEFKAAQQQLLKDHHKRLMVILLEKVDKNLLDKDLKLYLSTNTYLERSDTLFWEKLYFAMPDKKTVGQMHSTNNEDAVTMARDEVELQGELQELIP
ncbi:toll-like receptor Tollo [Acanthaster planci]|uniref:Toll-like receptor Tollo n=1 Tax=Acanthaster planci TaxID=133434 RepID=A0A8B7YY51_ACAPL|nr:toll-like receptor Tollo [Acanthaster planci]